MHDIQLQLILQHLTTKQNSRTLLNNNGKDFPITCEDFKPISIGQKF